VCSSDLDLAGEAADKSEKELEIDMSFFGTEGGLISGIGAGNLLAGNLFLAAYKSMAGRYFSAFAQLGVERSSVRRFIGAGGVLRKSPLLQNLLMERFGLELKLPPDSEDVMHGLLRLGRWHLLNAALLP
jgi:hypothetical protein